MAEESFQKRLDEKARDFDELVSEGIVFAPIFSLNCKLCNGPKICRQKALRAQWPPVKGDSKTQASGRPPGHGDRRPGQVIRGLPFFLHFPLFQCDERTARGASGDCRKGEGNRRNKRYFFGNSLIFLEFLELISNKLKFL